MIMAPILLVAVAICAANPHPMAAPGITSLTNSQVKYKTAVDHAVVLRRGQITAVVVDNHAVDIPAAPGHRAGYNGLASLSHRLQPANLFVPPYAGLNYEHIHDGTLTVNQEKFEPRKNSLELRIVDEQTVELYQPPTPNWKLESCGRYHILPDGVIEYTFECIPRADVFENGYIGLFWASYIHAPQDKAIHFLAGKPGDASAPAQWVRAVTPSHGVQSTHPPSGDLPELKIDPDFPLTLVNHRSDYTAAAPWYYGVSGKMAYAQMFRRRDQIWLAQSPTGGGQTNPAWDFQWFIPDYKVDEAYGFVMRAAYIPYNSQKQVIAATKSHREALNP